MTAVSTDEAIATVVKKSDGVFTMTLVAAAADADGKATINLTSGDLTAALAVTVTKPAEG